MAAQVVPTYSIAAGKTEAPIVNELAGKYGKENISWPIVLSEKDKVIAYLYERNFKNKVNSETGARPLSQAGLPNYSLDYTSSPRYVDQSVQFLNNFIDAKYSCSYDYIVKSSFSTVDLDYVWKTEQGFKGFELTTFFMDFYSMERAAYLISTINRRPSWQGANGAQALHKIVDCADDLGIDYYLVCVNTVSKEVGSDLKTSGNVYFFRLNHDQIERLSNGLPPNGAHFCSFKEFLDWL